MAWSSLFFWGEYMKLTENKLIWQTKRNYEYTTKESGTMLLIVATETEFPKEVDLSVMKDELFLTQSENEVLSIEKIYEQLSGVTEILNDLVFDFPEVRSIIALKNSEIRKSEGGFVKSIFINGEFVLGVKYNEEKSGFYIKRKVGLEVTDLFLIVRKLKEMI